MRICIINHAFGSPTVGPNMRHWFLIEALLLRKSFTKIQGIGSRVFHKYRVDPGSIMEDARFSIRYFPNIKYRGFVFQVINQHVFAIQAAFWCRKNLDAFDVFYFSSPPPLAMFYSRLIVPDLSRKKVIFEFRDLWPEILYSLKPGLLNTIYYAYLKVAVVYCYEKADKIFCVKKGEIDYLVGAYRIDREKIKHMPNSNPISQVSREFLTQVQSAVRFVYAGALSDYYDLELFFDGLVGISEDKYIVDIYGDGKNREYLENYVDQLGLKNVNFLGYKEKRELDERLPHYDYGLLFLKNVAQNRFGISTNKVFDYVNAGLPIVSSYISDFGPIEEHGIGYNCEHDAVRLKVLIQNIVSGEKGDNFSVAIKSFRMQGSYHKIAEEFENIVYE